MKFNRVGEIRFKGVIWRVFLEGVMIQENSEKYVFKVVCREFIVKVDEEFFWKS